MKEQILNSINKYHYDIGFYLSDSHGNVISYNENRKYESASCIKLFVLMEYFKQVWEKKISIEDRFTYQKSDHIPGLDSGIIGKLDYGLNLTSKDYALLMIIYSDNIATNKLIEYLGIENINKTIQEIGCKDTILHHELNLLKYFKFGTTTPRDYAYAYEKIRTNQFINEEVCKNILEILKKQQFSDIIKKGLPPYDVLFKGDKTSNILYIASKSGCIIYTGKEMKNCRNDGGIISTKYGEYIISIFISNVDDMRYDYDNKAIECGAEISRIAYNNFMDNEGEFYD